MYEHSAAERIRSLLLQAVLVALVVIGGLTVFETVSSATAPVADSVDRAEHTEP